MSATFRIRQGGASLIVTLLMLIAIVLIGVSAAQIALQGEKSSRNDRDRQVAFQAAEAALLDAEMDIEGATGASSRSEMFAGDSALGFVEGCGSGLTNTSLGLCSHAGEDAAPPWQTIDFLDDSSQARSVPYGHFTGMVFPTGEGPLPITRPRYIIELIRYNWNGAGAGMEDMTYFYRITADGFGTRDSTQVALQTFYRKGGK